LKGVALTSSDRVSLFVRGLVHFKPWYDEPFEPSPGECDCGRLGTHRTGGGWECDQCKMDNAMVVHLVDMPCRLTAEEWKEAQKSRLENYREHGRRRRQRIKMNRMLDNGEVACQSED